MKLTITMIVLNLLSVSSSSDFGFDNSVLKTKPWPIDNCSVVPEEIMCKTDEKRNCSICDNNGCKLNIALSFPAGDNYILNLKRVQAMVRDAIKNHTLGHEIKEMDDKCTAESGLGNVIDITEWCPHVIIGLPCDYALAGVARVTKYMGNYGAPLLAPSALVYDFTNEKINMLQEFYHLVNIGQADYRTFAEFLRLLFSKYKWKKFALMYEKGDLSEIGGENSCYLLMSTIVNLEFEGFIIETGDLVQLNYSNSAGYNKFLKEKVGVKYGIILTCASHNKIRKIMIEAARIGMMDRGEYLFFNFALYNNFSGLIMENPLLAEIFMDNLKNKINQHQLFKSSLYWYRFVDGILSCFTGPDRQLNQFLTHTNSLHKNAVEEEQHNSINFLDLTITRKDNKHDFAIFHKPSHIDLIIQNKSCHPYSQKMAAFNSFIHSADIPDTPWYVPNDTENNNELAKKAYDSLLTLYPYREADFKKVIEQEYRGSYYLEDIRQALLMYVDTIQENIVNNNSLRGCKLIQGFRGKYYASNEGWNMTLNCNVQRLSTFALVAQTNGKSRIMGTYSIVNKSIGWWDPGDFFFPADDPPCGYDLSKCPTYDKVNILLISLICVILVGLLIVATVYYRHYKFKAEIYSQAWKVSYDDIVFLSKDRRGSIHSITTIKDIDEMSLAGDKQIFATIGYYKSIRVAIKKLPNIKINPNHQQLIQLKAMKDLSNDNLVKFYGACIENPNNCLLIEYCQKGSLQDILENPEYNLDWTFRMSLIMDLARGMHYLHGSPIKSHGALKSSNCLVDSRFVLKISDFGLHFLRGNDKSDEADVNSYQYWKRFLWTAPELLKMGNPLPAGSQKADTYSFAIIMQEIIMREGVFYVKESTLEPKGQKPITGTFVRAEEEMKNYYMEHGKKCS